MGNRQIRSLRFDGCVSFAGGVWTYRFANIVGLTFPIKFYEVLLQLKGEVASANKLYQAGF